MCTCVHVHTYMHAQNIYTWFAEFPLFSFLLVLHLLLLSGTETSPEVGDGYYL